MNATIPDTSTDTSTDISTPSDTSTGARSDAGIGALSERAKIGCELIADGRTLRRDRNRARVLEAMIALADGGDPEPTIEAVANRAEVSHRSIYRYFGDRTDLTLSAIDLLIGDMWAIFEIDDLGIGSLDHRIRRFIESRMSAYRRLAPLTRLAIRLSVDEPVVLEEYERVRRHLRQQLEMQFAPELDTMPEHQRRLVVPTLNTMFQFEAFESLMHFEDFDEPTVARILACHLRSHLAAVDAVDASGSVDAAAGGPVTRRTTHP